MSLLLHNSPWVVRAAGDYLTDGAVYIDGSEIVAVGPSAELARTYPDAERLDCRDLMLIPGLINCHNHVYEILCRGIGRDKGTEAWLYHLIYPVDRALDDEDYYWAAVLAAADAFRTGTTCLVEQLTNFARFHADAEVRAFRDCGLRARVGRASSASSTIDPAENGTPAEELRSTEAYLDRWAGHALVQPWVSPSGFFSCDADTLRALKQLATAKGAGFKIHLSETRDQLDLAHARGYPGQVEWAYRTGLLGPDTLVAHAVWINDSEIDILRATGTRVVHNPHSNMIMASGVAPIPRLLRAGAHVALGTDGPASNDAQDMVAEMKAAVLLHRLATLDPTVLTAHDAFRMATEAGAAVVGLAGRLGRLEAGYLADIVGVGIGGNPCMQPLYEPVNGLVYHGSGRDVRLTIVDGRIVYRDGSYPTLDLAAALEHVQTRSMPKVRAVVGGEGAPPVSAPPAASSS